MRGLLDKKSYKLIIDRRKALVNHYWFTILRDAWLHYYKIEQLYQPETDYVPPNRSKLEIPPNEAQSVLLTFGGFIFRKGAH